MHCLLTAWCCYITALKHIICYYLLLLVLSEASIKTASTNVWFSAWHETWKEVMYYFQSFVNIQSNVFVWSLFIGPPTGLGASCFFPVLCSQCWPHTSCDGVICPCHLVSPSSSFFWEVLRLKTVVYILCLCRLAHIFKYEKKKNLIIINLGTQNHVLHWWDMVKD